MTNGASAAGGPPTSYTSGPSAGPVPRRLSYASVASGAAPHTFSSPSRSGPLSHLTSTTPNSSYPPQYHGEHRHSRSYSTQETEMNTNGSVPFGSSFRKPAPLPAYSRAYAQLPGYPWSNAASSNAFFVPSYLRHSRYAIRLEEAHKAKLQAQRETSSAPSSNPPSLSTSASNANVHRMAPSHRGMTYEIVESNPPKDEDHLMPLPSKLNDNDKYPGLDLSEDSLEVRYNGATTIKAEMDATMVRADYPMSPQCGIYYFEVEIRSKTKDGMIAVGFATQKASLERLPGWETESWGYHGDDGRLFCGESQPKAYSQPFQTGDVVGCGLDFYNNQAFFTKNGIHLDVAFRELKNIRPFPVVGMKKVAGAMATVNFGQKPFVFDIGDMMARHQRKVKDDIAKANVASLQPPMDESRLLQELVTQFLQQDGYVETAKAFAADVQKERRALHSAQDSPMDGAEVLEDFEAINRQEIRAFILEGDIEEALKSTRTHFPRALKQNPQIEFRLKCRKWVEMIRRSNELNKPIDRSSRSTTNGHAKRSTVDDVFDADMELDDQDVGPDQDWENMDSEDTDNAMESEMILKSAMDYGTHLNQEYGREASITGVRYRKMLEDIFSLIAYDDPQNSVHGHLLDLQGRAKVAEELNGAILVSLGRSSSAAIERLYRQTEVLVDELSKEGGPAAFVNLQESRPQ